MTLLDQRVNFRVRREKLQIEIQSERSSSTEGNSSSRRRPSDEPSLSNFFWIHERAVSLATQGRGDPSNRGRFGGGRPGGLYHPPWRHGLGSQWAWILWQLLQRVSDLLWDRYENDFIAFDLNTICHPPIFELNSRFPQGWLLLTGLG